MTFWSGAWSRWYVGKVIETPDCLTVFSVILGSLITTNLDLRHRNHGESSPVSLVAYTEQKTCLRVIVNRDRGIESVGFLGTVAIFAFICVKCHRIVVFNVFLRWRYQKSTTGLLITLSKIQKILPFFGKTENTAQSFIMGVYEKIFFKVF